ncbi:60S ribosomal protein L27 [Glarea lozoyensis ATCC 20868]|uniref:60S ribosomal protein L27 n=1 Tax=Glarea lozoyensis (strain ATCC 20868 / MF5171) TaxID=1116229 RepID=S3DE35_GLAL2|nr:60S ribosomal protein L27 [Glarea lozoyensis ATCC 20868]EPE36020.1 60S ribosomal protein L27 [Glarea lozoyensis ATCC 20868]
MVACRLVYQVTPRGFLSDVEVGRHDANAKGRVQPRGHAAGTLPATHWSIFEEIRANLNNHEPRQIRPPPTVAMKFLKVGRVAIITRGRYAGKKVVIIQPQDAGNKSHPYPHALVAGIERYPSQITRRMSKTRQEKRSKVKPFIKVINYNHLMPTRYTLELEGLKGAITADTFKEVSQREDAKKVVKKALEERYTSGKNRWFFTPLRF